MYQYDAYTGVYVGKAVAWHDSYSMLVAFLAKLLFMHPLVVVNRIMGVIEIDVYKRQVLVWHARCSYHLAIGRNYVISLGAALAAMTAVVFLLKRLTWTVPVMLFVLIAAAAAVYFGCLLLFRNDTVMELLHKGLERLQNR